MTLSGCVFKSILTAAHTFAMSPQLAKEQSLWNQLVYGAPRVPKAVRLAAFGREKHPRYVEETAIVSLQPKANSGVSRKLRMANTALVALLFTLGVFHLTFVSGGFKSDVTPVSRLRNHLSFTELGASAPGDASRGHEIFQVHYPELVRPYFGPLLKQVKLVDHTFGASYGQPAVVAYAPPDVDFDKVVLTLNTSVDGVQFDRLAHLFLEGRSLWRTSTIEPGGRLSFSSFQKDVSEYSILFQEGGTLVFQLDNVVDGPYTGKFHVELYADFYKSSESYEEDNTLQSAFSTHIKPRSIVPVGSSDIVNPAVSLPQLSLVYTLPSVPQNTTRLKLAIFTSGNAEEEFYYTNVLDRHTNWHNSTFYGHGPLRMIDVLYNGQIVANVNPQPVIFTGGISPSLWNPVVSTSAFDLRSYDVDLTALLPDLWEGRNSGENQLQIRVSNGGITKNNAINPVWSTSANLFAWESEKVKGVSGKIQFLNKKPRHIEIDVGSKSAINSIVTGSYTSRIESEFDIELFDGSKHTLNVTSQVHSSASNVERISNNGFRQSNVLDGKTKAQFSITEGKEPVVDTLVEHSYPLVLNLNQTNLADSTKLEVSIVGGKTASMTLNGTEVLHTYSLQNGTSTFYISKDGNHGDAKTTTKFRFTMSPPFAEVDYFRQVDTDHNQVVGDTNTPPHNDNAVAMLMESIDESTETWATAETA